jgi:hypothetical protein
MKGKSLKLIALQLSILFLLTVLPAAVNAAYRIVLKNGSEIVVETYAKENGEVRFYYRGGIVGIKEKDVEKILQVEDEALPKTDNAERDSMKAEAKDSAAEQEKTMVPYIDPAEKEKYQKELQERLKEVEAKIAEKEALLKKTEEEYRSVKHRLESLFQQGTARAAAKGQGAAQWLNFLTGSEREWAQQNTIKKRKLEEDKKILEEALVPLREQRDEIMRRIKETP